MKQNVILFLTRSRTRPEPFWKLWPKCMSTSKIFIPILWYFDYYPLGYYTLWQSTALFFVVVSLVCTRHPLSTKFTLHLRSTWTSSGVTTNPGGKEAILKNPENLSILPCFWPYGLFISKYSSNVRVNIPNISDHFRSKKFDRLERRLSLKSKKFRPTNTRPLVTQLCDI